MRSRTTRLTDDHAHNGILKVYRQQKRGKVADPNAVNYINGALTRGDSKEKIRSDFISHGWTKEAIDSVFNDIFGAGKPVRNAGANAAAGARQKRSSKGNIILLSVMVIFLAIAGAGYYAYSTSYYKELIGMVRPGPDAVLQPAGDEGSMDEAAEEEIAEDQYHAESQAAGQQDNASDALAESIQDEGTQTDDTSGQVQEEVTDFAPLDVQCGNCSQIILGIGGAPSVVSAGAEYGIAWSRVVGSNSRLYFARADSKGMKIGSVVLLAEKAGGISKKPSVAWTGTGYAIAWPVANLIYLFKADMDGNLISETEIVRSAGLIEKADMAWNGTEYGVVWSETGSKIYFERVGANGSRLLEKKEAGLISSSGTSIAWAKSEYGISWVENSVPIRKIYLLRIDPGGEKISTLAVINDQWFCNGTQISWADQRYGFAYSCPMSNKALKENDDEEVYYMRVHSTGGAAELIELDQGMVPLSESGASSKNPDIVLDEKNYGAVWEDDRDGNYEVYFNRINSYTGTKKEDAIRVSVSPNPSINPSIAWSGSEFGVAWNEAEGDRMDVYFARIS